MVEWSNIDGGGRGRGASDIPSFVFSTVSRESFATLSQLLLARIVAENYFRSILVEGIASRVLENKGHSWPLNV